MTISSPIFGDHGMMTPDNSESMIQAEVRACKSATRLDAESQGQPDDGHSSGPDPGSVDQAAAVPGGSPGK
jgi:hypothetical protein